MKNNTELKVSAIKDGTVIDHIPSKALFTVVSILGLNQSENHLTFGNNLDSKRLGKKAIIKISDTFFKDEEINKIALVAPEAKLNIIRDYKVVDKKEVQTPDEVYGIIKCVNPKCVTNNEKVTTRFSVIKDDKVALKCHYCEKITDSENFEFI